MIMTRMGAAVTIVSVERDENGFAKIVTVRFEDGEERERFLYELKADGGIEEIESAIAAAELDRQNQ